MPYVQAWPPAPRRQHGWRDRKDLNTEKAARTTEGHGEDNTTRFARSALDYSAPWPSVALRGPPFFLRVENEPATTRAIVHPIAHARVTALVFRLCYRQATAMTGNADRSCPTPQRSSPTPCS